MELVYLFVVTFFGIWDKADRLEMPNTALWHRIQSIGARRIPIMMVDKIVTRTFKFMR